MESLSGLLAAAQERSNQTVERAECEFQQRTMASRANNILGIDARPFWEVESTRVTATKEAALKYLGTILFFLIHEFSSLVSNDDEFRYEVNVALAVLRQITLDRKWPKLTPLSSDWHEPKEQGFDRALIPWLESREDWRKYEARVVPQIAAGPEPHVVDEEASSPLLYFEVWPLENLTVAARTRIRAKLSELHGGFLDQKVRDEVDCWRQTYELIAEEFDREGSLSEDLVKRGIPEMVADAAVGAGWSREPFGRVRPTGIFSDRFGSQFYPLWRRRAFLEALSGRMAHWSGRLFLNPSASSAGGKSVQNAWRRFLSRISSADLVLTYEDVCAWTADEFDALNGASLISEMARATHVKCDACPEGHWERVRWNEDGKQAFIGCTVAGTVDVNLDRLRQWRSSPPQFAVGLSKTLALPGEVQLLPASRVRFLGRRRTAGRTLYFFFAAIGPDELSSAIEAVRQMYRRVAGVLFVPFSPPTSPEGGKLTIIDLGNVVSLDGGRMVVDLQFIEDQFTGDHFGPQQGSPVKKTSNLVAAHRRSILRAFMTANSLNGIDALARRLGVSKSALHGMARGDRTRYCDDKLNAMLNRIGCPRPKWDRATKPARA